MNDRKRHFQNTVSGCTRQVCMKLCYMVIYCYFYYYYYYYYHYDKVPLTFFFTSSLQRWKFGGHTDNVTETQ